MKRAYLVIAAAAFALLSVGCGGNRSAEDYSDVDTNVSMADTASYTGKDVSFNTSNLPTDRKFIKKADLKFKVKNVLDATEEVEHLTTKFGGYTISSDIQNSQENSKEVLYSRDSLLKLTQIVVSNRMVLKVPSERIDSLVLALRPLFIFLDYRTIKLEDVTRRSEANTNVAQSYNEATPRMEKQIESREGKVNQGIEAEQQLVDNKVRAAEAQAARRQMEDDVKYSTLSVEIYQSPVLVREVTFNFNKFAQDQQSFFSRLIDSISDGWYFFKELFLAVVKLWSFALLLIGSIYLFRILKRKYKEMENTTPDKKE